MARQRPTQQRRARPDPCQRRGSWGGLRTRPCPPRTIEPEASAALGNAERGLSPWEVPWQYQQTALVVTEAPAMSTAVEEVMLSAQLDSQFSSMRDDTHMDLYRILARNQ